MRKSLRAFIFEGILALIVAFVGFATITHIRGSMALGFFGGCTLAGLFLVYRRFDSLD